MLKPKFRQELALPQTECQFREQNPRFSRHNALVSEIVDWLQTDHGQTAIEMAQEALKTGTDPLKLAAELDRRFSLPASYRTACTLQAELRNRLVLRWGQAPRWLLTRDGIEQATHPLVRHWRSQKLKDLGIATIADLGCGLGFESASFAEAGLSVVSVERDPEVHAIAQKNLNSREVHRFDVVTDSQYLDAVLEKVESVFVDPARRDANAARNISGNAGNRVSNPSEWSPSWDWALELGKRKPKLVAKVAPGISHDLLPQDSHTYWFAIRGSLVEASVWFDGFGIKPGKSAITINRFGEFEEISDADASSDAIGPIGKFVLDSSPAITRAGLVQQLAAKTNAHRIDEHLGFLSLETEPVDSALFTTYEVIETLEFDEKKISQALKNHKAYDVQVIARGYRGDIDALTKQLKKGLAGDKLICLLLARIGDKTFAILSQRTSS